jgi:hypothetical protein
VQTLKKIENDAKSNALTLIIEAVGGVNKRCSSASATVAGNRVSRSGAGVVVGAHDALDKSGCGIQDGGFEGTVCEVTEAPRGGETQLRFEVNVVGGVGVETREEAVVTFISEVGLRVSSAWIAVSVGLFGCCTVRCTGRRAREEGEGGYGELVCQVEQRPAWVAFFVLRK